MRNTKTAAERELEVQRLMIAARYWLMGAAQFNPSFTMALEALEFARGHHDGVRNDNTPEIGHQLGIFHYLRTLNGHLRNPAMCYTLVFLHDAIEDPNQKTGKWIHPDELEHRFGAEVLKKTLKLSKKILGVDNPEFSLEAVFADPDCGPVKGADRVNNVSTMYGVFKPTRLERYVKETGDRYFPLLKTARRTFIDQEPVYENIKLQLVNQLQLITHLMEKTPEEPKPGL